jgi:gliding motility-associated-like protein
MLRISLSLAALVVLSSFVSIQKEHLSFVTVSSNHLSTDDTLIVDDLVFSNFFSPNNDGFNDTFIILNLENYPSNSLKVFNRWGEVVYKAEPYLNDWNGINNQDPVMDNKCTDGVYFYEFNNGQGRLITGKITLKR